MMTIAPKSRRLRAKAIKAAESSNIERSRLRAIVFSPPVDVTSSPSSEFTPISQPSQGIGGNSRDFTPDATGVYSIVTVSLRNIVEANCDELL
jgi:hypothetical protein